MSSSNSSSNNNNKNEKRSRYQSQPSDEAARRATKARGRILSATKTVFSGFWDEGRLANDNRVDYDGLNLTIGNDVYEIGVGDTVMLRNDDSSSSSDEAEPLRPPSRNNRKVATSQENTSQQETNKTDYTVNAEVENQDCYGRSENAGATAPFVMEAKVGDGLMLARVEVSLI
jgi:hypothetical protein